MASFSPDFPIISIPVITPEPQQVWSSADEVGIFSPTIVPATANISPIIQKMLQSLAKDYMFECQGIGGYPEKIKATMTFDPQKGIIIDSCSDSKAKKCWENTMEQSCVSIPRAKLNTRQIPLLEVKPTSKMLEEAQAQSIKDPVFYNMAAFSLWSQGVKTSSSVHVEFENWKPQSASGGITTAELRYPHMLKDMRTRCHQLVMGKPKVCIVGPGMANVGEKNEPSCPQLVELMGLFVNGEFDLLDNNEELIKTMQDQTKAQRLPYLPLAYRMLTDTVYSFRAPESYQKMLSGLKNRWVARINQEEQTPSKELLSGTGPLKTIYLKPYNGQVRATLFDITKDSPKKAHYDLIIATNSLSLVLSNYSQSDLADDLFKGPAKLLAPQINALKEEGVLYIDWQFKSFVTTLYGNQAWTQLLGYLASTCNCTLEEHYLPISDLAPTINGDIASLTRPSIDSKSKMLPISITSSSIIAIVKKKA